MRSGIFPYPFHADYSPDKIDVIHDPEKGMRYVIQDGKRLYFKKDGVRKELKEHTAI